MGDLSALNPVRRHLVLVASSGLGNRMRALLTGETVADRAQRMFHYHWQIGPDFEAKIGDLWDFDRSQIGGRTLKAVARISARADDYETILANQSARWVLTKTGYPITDRSTGWYKSWHSKFRNLVPSASIRERVNSFYYQNLRSKRFIGVSVRAHSRSHQKTKDESPPSWFIQRMLDLKKDNPDVNFFLSCDDMDVQREIISAVPDVMAQKKESGYNSSTGVIDAVVDLYLLGLATHLIGPYWSSFIDMGIALAGDNVAYESSKVPFKGDILAGSNLNPDGYAWLNRS